MHPEILAALEADSIILSSQYPRLSRAIERHVARGELKRVLGDAYSAVGPASSFEVRVAAARAVHPNCVFVRETAARLTWLPTIQVDRIQAASNRRHPSAGFTFERRLVPQELTAWDGTHYVSTPALTVLDLTDSRGASAISDALRLRLVTIEDLHRALDLTKGRPGNVRRAQLVREARDLPWSELERDAHVRLRRAHLKGWVANHPVVIRNCMYYIDIALPELKLAVEIDGWQHHKAFDSFVSDRARWNALTLAGWTVLHFTASTMDELVPQLQEGVLLRGGK